MCDTRPAQRFKEPIVNKACSLLLVSAIVFGSVEAQAQSALSVRVRGTITGFDGHELQVKSRDDKKLHIDITDATKIKTVVAHKLSDIKQGSFVGVTAIRKVMHGPLVAREVHIFPEAQRGVGEGHYAWDLEPGSTMTNANVDAIVHTKAGTELTLSYKEGRRKIIVPRDVPIVSFRPADKSALRKGMQIFCIAQESANGSLKAKHISVGKNGMKPPM